MFFIRRTLGCWCTPTPPPPPLPYLEVWLDDPARLLVFTTPAPCTVRKNPLQKVPFMNSKRLPPNDIALIVKLKYYDCNIFQ